MSEPEQEEELQRHEPVLKSDFISVWMVGESSARSVNQTLDIDYCKYLDIDYCKYYIL